MEKVRKQGILRRAMESLKNFAKSFGGDTTVADINKEMPDELVKNNAEYLAEKFRKRIEGTNNPVVQQIDVEDGKAINHTGTKTSQTVDKPERNDDDELTK